jgi:hypothetical protein
MAFKNVQFPKSGFDWRAVLTGAGSDSVLIRDDATNNPEGYEYAYIYVLTTLTATVLPVGSTSTKTIASVAANTIVPFPVARVNSTGLTGTYMLLVP